MIFCASGAGSNKGIYWHLPDRAKKPTGSRNGEKEGARQGSGFLAENLSREGPLGTLPLPTYQKPTIALYGLLKRKFFLESYF
jgi:hypothetical protein